MLARYIVIAIYGLDAFFGKDAIYLVYDIKNNCVCNYFESDSEAFLCCDELNKKDLHCHILIEAMATYNDNKVKISSPYIKKKNNIIVVISEYLQITIEKLIFDNGLPKEPPLKLNIT